jgi:hypothetical protein
LASATRPPVCPLSQSPWSCIADRDEMHLYAIRCAAMCSPRASGLQLRLWCPILRSLARLCSRAQETGARLRPFRVCFSRRGET